MTQEQIDKAVQRYNKLASRRDGRINVPALNEIAAKLAQVPPGTRPDVDLLLGRPAELPERVEYCRWSTDAQRAAWQASGAAETARLAEEKQTEHDAYLERIADQYADMLDWHRIYGDLGL